MSQIPNSTAYIGYVGKDRTGEILQSILLKEGVKSLIQETDEAPTGRCAVLVLEKDRFVFLCFSHHNHVCLFLDFL